MVAGETERGLAFMGGFLLSYGLIIDVASDITYDEYNNAEITSQNRTKAILGFIGLLGTWIWSTGDAVRVAKVNNMAFREQQKKISFKFSPEIIPLRNQKRVGAGLKLQIGLD